MGPLGSVYGIVLSDPEVVRGLIKHADGHSSNAMWGAPTAVNHDDLIWWTRAT